MENLIETKLVDYDNIIFLDKDGVLNCQLHYDEYFSHLERFDNIPFYKTVKKYLRKVLKNGSISPEEYQRSQISRERMELVNWICKVCNAVVVISASMRSGYSIDELRKIFNDNGATFRIIDKTPYTGYERGTEISKWLSENIKPETHGCHSFDYKHYAIIDDDNDFLIEQAQHLFQTDTYSGLNPMIADKVRKFLTGKTFNH